MKTETKLFEVGKGNNITLDMSYESDSSLSPAYGLFSHAHLILHYVLCTA